MRLETKLQEYARVLNDLHSRWMPHAGQIPIGKAIFVDGLDDIFLECGRNFGKTELLDYLYWRIPLTRPETRNYLFYPFIKQGREVVWKSKRMQNFGPEHYIESTNDTEMRITFINGSFIKIDGSDNVESYRGVKIRGGGLWGYDEYKDHRPEFHDAVEPNLLECILIRAGTPPYGDNHFTQHAEQVKADPRGFYINRSCLDNPHIPQEKLERTRLRLIALGEEYKWECEYLAKRVKGGPGHLIPQAPGHSLKPHHEVLREIEKDKHHLEYFAITDPGSASVHATLFGAVNPYSKKVYLLDEIYETNTALTSTSKIGKRIFAKTKELGGHTEWRFGYDEAATWFKNEMEDQSPNWEGCDGIYYEATEKSKNNKEDGLSLIKDLFIHERFVISDRCVKLKWEMDNYYKDEKGRIPKKDDHLIDDLRYLLAMAGYEFDLENPPIPEAKRPERGYTMQDDFPELVDEYAEFDSGDDYL